MCFRVVIDLWHSIRVGNLSRDQSERRDIGANWHCSGGRLFLSVSHSDDPRHGTELGQWGSWKKSLEQTRRVTAGAAVNILPYCVYFLTEGVTYHTRKVVNTKLDDAVQLLPSLWACLSQRAFLILPLFPIFNTCAGSSDLLSCGSWSLLNQKVKVGDQLVERLVSDQIPILHHC